MKYKFLFLASICMLLLMSGTALAAEPINISSFEDFMAINPAVSSGAEYRLTGNIDATGKTFTPVGTASDPFKGSFDGQGYTISNITYNSPTTDNVGLFGYAEDAAISNLSLRNVSFEGNNNVGGLIGWANNTSINYCSVVNTGSHQISGNNEVGGFVGRLVSSSISNNYAMGDAKGTGTSVGGFVGYIIDTDITSSYAMGDTEGNIYNVGGFVGYMESSSISKSYANGNVNGIGNFVGGFVGAMMTNSFISESYSNGDVIGTSHLGGFVGYIIDSDIANCYSMGNATGILQRVGGFVGHMRSSTIKNSYAAGNADGPSGVGGFVGSAIGTITDSFYIGEPNSTNTSLGFFVTPETLKKIATFKTEGGVVSDSWNITIDPDPNSIWYIDEGMDYPRFYWTYHPLGPDQNPGSGHRTGGATIVNPSPSSSSSSSFEPQNPPEPDPVESPKPEPPEQSEKNLSLIGLILMLTAVLIAMTQGYKAAKLNSKGIENPNLIYQIIIVLAAIAAVIVFFMTSSLGGKIILLGIGGIIIALLFLVQIVLLTKFYLQKNKK